MRAFARTSLALFLRRYLAIGIAFGITVYLPPVQAASPTLLHGFRGSDGWRPRQPVLGPDGAIYGVTNFYPLADGSQGASIYRVSEDGVFKTIHAFSSTESPNALLTFASDGLLYGVTPGGGNSACSVCGTIFRMKLDGSEFRSFAPFDGAMNGGQPAGLTVGPGNDLYGVSTTGGANGRGTIFRFTLAGNFRTLYSFDLQDNLLPSPLTVGPDGNLYGTANSSTNGTLCSEGMFYRISPTGVYTRVACFTGGISTPIAQLTMGPDGIFYSTSNQGGSEDLGTIYSVDTNGNFKILHSFAGNNGRPENPVLIRGDGSLLGVADGATGHELSAVYQLSPNGVYSLVAYFPRVPAPPQTVPGRISNRLLGLAPVRNTLYALALYYGGPDRTEAECGEATGCGAISTVSIP